MSQPLVPIRVRVLDREYPLRVAPGDEDYTQRLAQHVDERMRRLQKALPTQTDLTHAVLTALQLAEEMYAARAETDHARATIEIEASGLVERLERALTGRDLDAG
jgi:cell division protein ZapA